MSEKMENIKKQNNLKQINDLLPLVDKKIEFYKDVIQKTIIHVYKNKNLDILGISDVNSCVEKLYELNTKIIDVYNHKNNHETMINNLQIINNELSSLLKNYGTESLEDLLIICFGNNNKFIVDDREQLKLDILKKYFHPTSYKVNNKKPDENKEKKTEENKEKITDDNQSNHKNLSCTDVSTSYKQFHMKVYGIKLNIYSSVHKKSLIIFGIVDDIIVDFLNNKYITDIRNKIYENLPNENEFNSEYFKTFMTSLTLKDYLMYEDEHDIYNKFQGYISYNNNIKQKQISQVVKEFISDDIYNKRVTLINLLIYSSNNDNQYMAYLLYDLLSNDTNGTVDTQEQVILFDSFPWSIKQYFKLAMKKTIQYTNDLSNFDINKIPLEQQICLLKASDIVKEKAMIKLKEVKAKSEDSGTKARQYLDGLLKIPFGVYKKEPILNIMETNKNTFRDLIKKYDLNFNLSEIPLKEKYTNIEINKYIKIINYYLSNETKNEKIDKIKNYLILGDRKKLITNNKILDGILKKFKKPRTKYSNLNKDELINRINDIINNFQEDCEDNTSCLMINELINEVNVDHIIKNIELKQDLDKINNNMKTITTYMSEVKSTLDKAVHGHEKAKKQIERIIGQWINGELDGYCFGFEGVPGVGKTTLAKRGLSNCLKDDKGNSRPFAMIQMGGDSNGSTLHGHNYTYVGSTWGSIVQILIDKKCMNPIIFIDEVDKISRTEHGKEIVGILTHLLDPAQNDCFQDKYFSGIDLDLSKALFILSYNDADAIDRILLDRVHRIKFNNLTLEDKLIISKTHILPDIYKKMGLEDMIEFKDDVLKFIIEEYTIESGVRKLKEVLFEIIGEINLDVLKNIEKDVELPVIITIDDVKNKYFKDKHEIKYKKIHLESKIGIINGLWANSLGRGGVIPIQVSWRPSEKFLTLHLTGMQGDVMKESMNVALTLAWDITNSKRKTEIWNEQSHNLNGVHIHCPEGATPKDGPSAGTAITTAIYSLLNNKKIKYNIAITGEICLNGNVTEIGGLDLKILGAIKAGVKEILFPTENMKDYNDFMEKYRGSNLINDIKFYPVKTINEVFELVFE